MSRLAKKPLTIPEGVTVRISGDNEVTVAGPLATLTRRFPPTVVIKNEENSVRVSLRESVARTPLLGTAVSHLSNMMYGSKQPFTEKLVVEGIGFKAAVKGSELTLSLGFSHPIVFSIPKGLTVTAEKNVLTVSGADLEAVCQFAASVRLSKRPEPYKGKGVRYEGEVIRRKQGKKTV